MNEHLYLLIYFSVLMTFLSVCLIYFTTVRIKEILDILNLINDKKTYSSIAEAHKDVKSGKNQKIVIIEPRNEVSDLIDEIEEAQRSETMSITYGMASSTNTKE